MLTRNLERCVLYGVPKIGADGVELRQELSEIRAAFTSRSAEEVTEADVSRCAETVHAVIPSRYAPPGGFLRGMIVRCGARQYRMLTPVHLGRLWNVKCVRVHV